MSFDRLAPHYRWMELVLAGGKLHRCRTHFLDQIGNPRTVLLAGEGHGRGLVECCLRYPEARIVCLDASSEMLRQAASRLGARRQLPDNIEFVHANILEWNAPAGAFDLIITNFFLDCFPGEQLARVVRRLAAASEAGANWLLSDFQLPAAGLKRVRARIILWSMYLFFRAVTRLTARQLEIPDPLLRAAGFSLRRRVETEWGLLRSDWWTLRLS